MLCGLANVENKTQVRRKIGVKIGMILFSFIVKEWGGGFRDTLVLRNVTPRKSRNL